jgi:CBS domain containing-hemolysin-like protein
MLTALGLVAVLALILANGYFVAAEFAFVAARRGRLEAQAQAGDRRARRALAVLPRLSFMLSGAQLGITVTSLVVGYIAEATLGRAIRPLLEFAGIPAAASIGLSLTLGFAVATTAQMVLGELAPKNIAIARAEPVALALARPTALYMRLAGPIISLFDTASNRLLRAVGIEPAEALRGGRSVEELGLVIREAERGGALTARQTALLHRALEFSTLRAVDAMVPRPHVVSLPRDASCEDLRQLSVDSGHSRFPLVGTGLDDVLGVVQAKDVLKVPPERRATTPARTLLQEPLAVPEQAPLNHLLADMREARVPLAVVIDEYGGTAGIVTLEDIVEELVGSIQDEYDLGEPGLQRRSEGSYLVPGHWRLHEVERDTGLELPEGDYDTLAGLVMARLGRVPRVGDVVQLKGVACLQVEAMDGMAVSLVRVDLSGRTARERGERA